MSAYGQVWELHGGRKGPVDRGTGRETVDVVRERVKQQGDGAYSLLGLVEGVASHST